VREFFDDASAENPASECMHLSRCSAIPPCHAQEEDRYIRWGFHVKYPLSAHPNLRMMSYDTRDVPTNGAENGLGLRSSPLFHSVSHFVRIDRETCVRRVNCEPSRRASGTSMGCYLNKSHQVNVPKGNPRFRNTRSATSDNTSRP
jgi:hypothetical protein